MRTNHTRYVHEASGLLSWSMELLAYASRLFAPTCLDHLSGPCYLCLWVSVAGGTARYALHLVYRIYQCAYVDTKVSMLTVFQNFHPQLYHKMFGLNPYLAEASIVNVGGDTSVTL